MPYDDEARDLIQILSRESYPSVVLVHELHDSPEPIIKALVRHMDRRAELDAKGGSASVADKLSATPQGFRYQSVLELDPLRLASASQMMGGAEQYLQSLFERLKADPSVLLYIGDLSLLKPLGRTGGEVLEALFVGLAKRRMQCIAHATPATYSQSVERSEAASLSTTKYIIKPLEGEALRKAFERRRAFLADYHSVSYQTPYEELLALAQRYFPQEPALYALGEILDAAAKLVKPQGRLVYATCSVLPEENEMQVERFLEEHSEYELLDCAELLAGLKIDLNTGKYLRLDSAKHQTDGFFAAVLQRKE